MDSSADSTEEESDEDYYVGEPSSDSGIEVPSEVYESRDINKIESVESDVNGEEESDRTEIETEESVDVCEHTDKSEDICDCETASALIRLEEDKAYVDGVELSLEEYDKLIESGLLSCGAWVIVDALEKVNVKTNYFEIYNIRNKGWGKTVRGILSVFNKDAGGITMPHEMEQILDYYGVKYFKIKGKNKLDKADEEIEKGRVVFARIGPYFDQHWTIYEGNDRFYDDLTDSARNQKIRDVYVLKKE